MNAQANNVIPYLKNAQIAAYDVFRDQLSEWANINESITFDYESPSGNKEARSHVYKLRQSKAAVEKARKEQKKDVLERGRLIDSEAQEITAIIEQMIDVHQKPLDEIEKREKERVDGINSRIAHIKKYQECAGHSSVEIYNALADLKSIEIDGSFAEFKGDALEVLHASIKSQEYELTIAIKREAAQAELEKLRKEAAERAQKEHEEAIAKAAAEKARAEAEATAKKREEEAAARAKAVREAAAKRELELRLAAEKAQREKAEAVECERQRVKAEAEQKAAEDARREANRNHQANIHKDILAALANLDVLDGTGRKIIEAIRKGDIPHVKIIY